MLRSILVPLDGSRFSELALPFAERLADGETRVTLLRALTAHGLPDVDTTDTQLQQIGEADTYLRGIAGELALPVKPETAVFFGSPGKAIMEEIEIRHADLVVMATHGRSGPGRALYGSTADHVLRHAPVPVLLVPSRCTHQWPEDRPVRIAVTLDGSDFSESVLGPLRHVIRALEGRSGVELLLVRIVDVAAAMIQLASGRTAAFDASAEIERADRYLEGLAAGLRTVTPRIRTFSELGSPGNLIAEVAEDAGADLIAMATHGRGGLSRVVLGSVATSTVRHAGVPVFLSRPVPARVPVREPVLSPSTSRLRAAT
ncbi:MAG TPA: universal stress protein [Chloroflexota bacterium]|nr:universal stress protein [Chloroflexota bacterium]